MLVVNIYGPITRFSSIFSYPLSLATTNGLSLDSHAKYSDASLPWLVTKPQLKGIEALDNIKTMNIKLYNGMCCEIAVTVISFGMVA